MIKIGAKISGADFRMINITKKGLEERSNHAINLIIINKSVEFMSYV